MPTKAELRRTIRADRANRPSDLRTAARTAFARSETVTLFQGSTTLASFLPTPEEPDPSRLTAALGNVAVAYPRVSSTSERAMEWVVNPTQVTTRDKPPHVPEPAGEPLEGSLWNFTQTLIIPGLASDENGVRLGQGGGFYDTLLSTKPTGALVVLILFDEEVFPAGEVPHESHDAVADIIVTPTRIIRVAGS